MVQVYHRLEERNHRSPSSVARNIRKTRKRLTAAAAISAVRVELIGANCATTLGIEAHGPSPVLALCRALVEAGHDPATSDMLALRVRSIGEGARLTVEDNHIGKPVFRRCRDRAESGGAAPPVRETASATPSVPPSLRSRPDVLAQVRSLETKDGGR